MITEVALVALTTGALAATLTYAYHRVQHYKEMYEGAEVGRQELLEDVVRLEREAQKRQDEFDHHKKMFDYLKDSINTLLSRPIFAQLSDQQANAFIQSVVQYLGDASKGQEGMN